MTPTTITTLACAAGAGGLAWSLGGREGTGVVLGALAGASAACASVALQRTAVERKPALLIHAVLAGFLLKAFLVLGLTLAIRFVPRLAEIADGLAFLLSYATVAIVILCPATFETLRALDGRTRTTKPLAKPVSNLEGGRAL